MMHLAHDPVAAIETTTAIFRSTWHPGQMPRQWVFALALIRPLMVCMLPVMVGALLAVLQGFPALVYLTIGFPAASVVAMLWTLFRIQARLAEIRVRPGAAAVVTIWQAAASQPELVWQPIFEIRTHAKELSFGLGDASYELDPSRWPDADALVEALRAARHAEFIA